ncbi:hypothetical protein ACHAWF_007191 [Thalassiosira exigua]
MGLCLPSLPSRSPPPRRRNPRQTLPARGWMFVDAPRRRRRKRAAARERPLMPRFFPVPAPAPKKRPPQTMLTRLFPGRRSSSGGVAMSDSIEAASRAASEALKGPRSRGPQDYGDEEEDEVASPLFVDSGGDGDFDYDGGGDGEGGPRRRRRSPYLPSCPFLDSCKGSLKLAFLSHACFLSACVAYVVLSLVELNWVTYTKERHVPDEVLDADDDEAWTQWETKAGAGGAEVAQEVDHYDARSFWLYVLGALFFVFVGIIDYLRYRDPMNGFMIFAGAAGLISAFSDDADKEAAWDFVSVHFYLGEAVNLLRREHDYDEGWETRFFRTGDVCFLLGSVLDCIGSYFDLAGMDYAFGVIGSGGHLDAMKLIVKIKRGKEETQITLPVGNGAQTVKWLAGAAAYRLVNDTVHHGTMTRPGRERRLGRRTQLLPKDVYTDDTPFLHPYDVVRDRLADGDTVCVDLYDTLELDEYGAPVLSAWARIAYRLQDRHREERERLAEEKRVEVETFKTEREAAALVARMNVERPKIERMRQVMASQLLSDDMIAATLSQDWSLIKNSGILENIVPDEGQQEEIRAFFFRYFVELSDMYKFYSAVNSGGGTHTLEYIELCKFLTETGILSEEHSNAILRIFVDSHIRHGKSRGVRPSIHSEIHRPEFFVSLIKIAILKNITLPKKELSKRRKQGHQVSISQAKLPSASRALEMVYQDFLSPVLENMPAGTRMREAVASESVLILLHDNLAQLVQCFEKYAESDDDEATVDSKEFEELSEVCPVPQGSMTCQRFGTFATDAGFVDSDVVKRKFSVHGKRHSIMGNRSSHSITQKDVRQIFSASQHDSDEPNEIEQSKIADDENLSSHHELMIFSEFLEAVARLGVLKYQKHANEDGDNADPEEALSHYECIQLAVQQVCSASSSTEDTIVP